MYYRIFGTNDSPVEPAGVLQHLQNQGYALTAKFRGDGEGWFRVELGYPDADARIDVERYLGSEEGMRAHLNTWAAWLEEACPDEPRWLQHIISTTQVLTIESFAHSVDEPLVHDVCQVLCRYFAHDTAGIYQVDGAGFFTADGTLIVPENESDDEPDSDSFDEQL
jgi:hypothetical protein